MATRYRLITLAEAKDQLSILDNAEDARVDTLVINASQDVMAWVNQHLDDWTDTNGVPLVDAAGNPQRVNGVGTLDSNGDFVLTLNTDGDPIDAGMSVIPGPVQQAVKVLIARMDDDREGAGEHFNDAVKALLWFYHGPVTA